MERYQTITDLVLYSVAEVLNNWNYIVSNWDRVKLVCSPEIRRYIQNKYEAENKNK